MNYFVEGLQGSGKSTLAAALAARHPEYRAIREGEYSPVELAWCAYVNRAQYDAIRGRYPDLQAQIEEKSFEENGRIVILYTKIRTDIPGFYRDLEQYEIYNGRRTFDEFRGILLERYRRWSGADTIFECSLFQNITEELTLFRVMTDEQILDFYREIKSALAGKAFHILYLKTEDIAAGIDAVRKERTDENGKEVWFSMLLSYFDASPYAKHFGVSGEAALLRHLEHRQGLELSICRALFPGQYTVLPSKGYGELDAL